jgi:secreted PhoX family phosphatase
MRNIFTISLLLLAFSSNAQVNFEPIDSNYGPKTVIVPGNPASFQILFTGGVDVVRNHKDEFALAKEWHDFLGFVEKGGKTYLICNHEMNVGNPVLGDGGGMTVWQVKKEANGSWSRVGEFRNVDFSEVGGTMANCGGIQAPNGRIWTAEEWMQYSNPGIYGDPCNPGTRDTNDFTIDSDIDLADGATIDKYENYNWMVEIDVENAKAIRKQYNMGRFGHEGGVITPDMKTVYLTDDTSPGCFYKFEASTANDFTEGQLYVYKQDAGKYTGAWAALPMHMDSMLNVQDIAVRLGGTLFMRGEWIDMAKNGKIYWTETGRDDAGKTFAKYKGNVAQHHLDRGYVDNTYTDYFGRVIVFDPADNSMKVFLEGGDGATANDGLHLSNPDGLTFLNVGGKEYLVIQEDLNGISEGRVPSHALGAVCEVFLLNMTQANPNVDHLKRLAIGTLGAEVTGARASSDGTTLFLNIQHPFSGMNTSKPSAARLKKSYENTAFGIGLDVYPYNHSMTLAINNLDDFVWTSFQEPGFSGHAFEVYPNPATRFLKLSRVTNANVYDVEGTLVMQVMNTNQIDIADLPAGTYLIKASEGETVKFVIE